jgi:hypothetical protein
MHQLPLLQLFALSAYAAYAQGMEPAGATYEDLEYDRELAAIKARKMKADGQAH